MKGTINTIHEIGKRGNQEDCLYPSGICGQQPLKHYILCDGMGGHSHGEVASGIVCRVLPDWLDTHAAGREITEADFKDALNAVYDAMDELDTEETSKKMGTTLTFVSFGKNGVLAAHIGDSRIYHIRPSAEPAILYRSEDHSLVNDLYRIGEITKEEMATSKSRHILTRAVQPHQEYRSEADIRLLTDVRTDDYFYLCSDGMLENITDEELIQLFSTDVPDEEKIRMLLANSAENKDNHSAILIRVTDDGTENCGADDAPHRQENVYEPVTIGEENVSFIPKGIVGADDSKIPTPGGIHPVDGKVGKVGKTVSKPGTSGTSTKPGTSDDAPVKADTGTHTRLQKKSISTLPRMTSQPSSVREGTNYLYLLLIVLAVFCGTVLIWGYCQGWFTSQ